MKPFKAEWCLDDASVLPPAASAASLEPNEPREQSRTRGRGRRLRGGRRRRPLSNYRSRFE